MFGNEIEEKGMFDNEIEYKGMFGNEIEDKSMFGCRQHWFFETIKQKKKVCLVADNTEVEEKVCFDADNTGSAR